MSLIQWVVELFEEMELYLMQSMSRNLQRHMKAELDEGAKWTQWQALQLKEINQFKTQVSQDVNEVYAEAEPAVEKVIRQAFHDGANGFDKQYAEANPDWGKLPIYESDKQEPIHVSVILPEKWIEMPDVEVVRADIDIDMPNPNLVLFPKPEATVETEIEIVPPGDDTFFKINEPKIKALVEEIQENLEKTRFAAINRMGSAYDDILRKADLFHQTGTMTLEQAVDMASKEVLAAGLNCVTYSNGRRVNIASYIEMALRTSARRATLTAEGAKRDEWKEYLVISPTLHSTCPTCQIWQGKVLIDNVFAHGKSDGKHLLLSEALQAPSHFLGPNCRHPLVSFFEGITQVPKESPHDKTKRQYEAEQRQRRLELMIRKYKRLREGSLNGNNQRKYAALVVKWEKVLKQHLEDNPQLRRKPEREKIVQGLAVYAPIEARNPADGTGAGVFTGTAKLSKRQKKLDQQLANMGDQVFLKKKDASLKDLSALTAQNNCEYALFTKKGERLLCRGSKTNAMLSEKKLIDLAKVGWRFSGHTHPGVGQKVRLSSQGDRNVLKLFRQERSVIYDAVGNYDVFRKGEE